MKSTNKKKISPKTVKKNTSEERPILEEDFGKKGGKGITASKGGIVDVSEMKGKSEKKGK